MEGVDIFMFAFEFDDKSLAFLQFQASNIAEI